VVGADRMQRSVQVPSATVTVLQGLVVIFVVGSELFVRRLTARRATANTTKTQTMTSPTLPTGGRIR